MGTLRRGVKNSFRNSIRTLSMTLILGISFALALVMILSLQAVRQRISQVSTTSGNTISVTPAGFGGFGFGGGNPLTAANLATISATPHVVAVAASVTDRLVNPATGSSGGPFGGGAQSTTSTTTLTSPIAGGALGNRFGGGTGATFVPPVQVTGTSTPTSPLADGSALTIIAGHTISGSSTDLDALVGSSLAAKNSLTVGSGFTAYGKKFTVEGIFRTSSTFANAGLIMPIKTVEALSGITGPTSATVTVDSISNLSSTAASLQSRLGASVATVSVGTPGSQTIVASYNSIEQVSLYSLVGALIAASIILLLCMLMIVRERRREIGVVKAFGSSNGGVVGSFVTEAFTLTVLGGAVGVVLGALLANPVLSILERSTSSSGGGRPGGFGGAGFRPTAVLSDLHAAVGPSLLLYGVLAAFGIALLGSAIPAYLIAKVRPASVMRSE
jgi:putative ABC transport system permease protein